MTDRPPRFSTARIRAVAGNTLLELVRLKVFYFLLIFALLIIGSSAFMVEFTFQEQFQVLKDVCLGAMSIFSWLLAVLSASMLLPKDMEDRTLYTILAKPVRRFEYLCGKWLGVLFLLFIAVGVMALMFGAALYVREQIVIAHALRDAGHAGENAAEAVAAVKAATFTPGLLPGIAIIYLKAAVFASLTLFISTFATSWIFTVIVSTVIYLIGHVQAIARDYWIASGHGSIIAKTLLGLIAVFFPDLQLFNLVDDIVVGNAISAAMFLKTAGLGVGYVAIYLMLAQLMFAGREL